MWSEESSSKPQMQGLIKHTRAMKHVMGRAEIEEKHYAVCHYTKFMLYVTTQSLHFRTSRLLNQAASNWTYHI